MGKRILASCLLVLCTVLPTSVWAINLIQVYRQALTSDPTFQKARSDWLSAKENLPLARTGTGAPGSGLFPNLGIQGNFNKTYQTQESGGVSISGNFTGDNYLITLTQPIFNWATWKSISSASFSVKSATATYFAAIQDLMFRVSSAYFNVLRANDQLRYTLMRKKSYLQELVTSEQKFQVGLIAITGVYDAQASYDQAIADEIRDRNNVQDQLEDLRAITGRTYRSMAGLGGRLPLAIPRPRNIDKWVKIAQQQNYAIKSSLYALLSAREAVKETAAGSYPTLTASGTYGTTRTGALTVGAGIFRTTSGTGELTLNFPAFQGGHVFIATQQKEYDYLTASNQLELTHRTVVNQTRQSYLGVQSGISQIKADLQAIKSAQNKLEATQAGYVVGTRTMVDVLQAVTALYETQQAWADNRYAYIMSIITLKQQASTLSPADLARINKWLPKTIRFSFNKPVVRARSANLRLPSPTQDASPPAGGQPTRIFREPSSMKLKTPPPTTVIQPSPPPATDVTVPPSSQQTIKPKLIKSKPLRPGMTLFDKPYAIQVFADHRLSAAKKFMGRQRSKTNLQIVYKRKQSGWYFVVYGQFATRAEANRTLRQLPSGLKRYHPWVVRVPTKVRHASKAALPVPAVAAVSAPATPIVPASTQFRQMIPAPTATQHLQGIRSVSLPMLPKPLPGIILPT